jgi:hypothetical protein
MSVPLPSAAAARSGLRPFGEEALAGLTATVSDGDSVLTADLDSAGGSDSAGDSDVGVAVLAGAGAGVGVLDSAGVGVRGGAGDIPIIRIGG